MPVDISRRELLKASAVLAAAGATLGCGAPENLRASAVFASLPHRDDYLPVVRALSETLLPFEHPRFPALTQRDVEAQLLRYFPLDDVPELHNLRRALVYFGDVGLSPHAAAPITQAERELLENAGVSAPGHEVEQRVARDRRASEQLDLPATAFVELGPSDRARYVESWATSALATKRRFYRATKGMVMVAAFSLEPSWKAIGYEGPLLKGRT